MEFKSCGVIFSKKSSKGYEAVCIVKTRLSDGDRVDIEVLYTFIKVIIVKVFSSSLICSIVLVSWELGPGSFIIQRCIMGSRLYNILV